MNEQGGQRDRTMITRSLCDASRNILLQVVISIHWLYLKPRILRFYTNYGKDFHESRANLWIKKVIYASQEGIENLDFTASIIFGSQWDRNATTVFQNSILYNIRIAFCKFLSLCVFTLPSVVLWRKFRIGSSDVFVRPDTRAWKISMSSHPKIILQ